MDRRAEEPPGLTTADEIPKVPPIMITVAVPGEDRYTIHHILSPEQMDEARADLVDLALQDMFEQLRRMRQLRVLGECERETCRLPKARKDARLCSPHEREKFFLEEHTRG